MDIAFFAYICFVHGMSRRFSDLGGNIRYIDACIIPK